MKTLSKLSVGIALFILFSSCVSNKMLTSSVSPTAIHELAYFEPISYIHLIEKGNKSKYNDSLSRITTTEVEEILLNNKEKLNLSHRITIEDDTLMSRIKDEITLLIQAAILNKSLDALVIPPTIDSILKSKNQRFSLAVVSSGFGRRKGNYGGQVAKSLGVGLLTMGMYIPVPVKSNITMYALIFDSQLNNVAFFKRTKPLEKSPTDSEILEKQIRKLFEGYFFEPPRY